MAEATIPETPETEARINALMAAVAGCQMSEETYETASEAEQKILSMADTFAHWIDNGTDSIRFTCDPKLTKAIQD